MKSYKSCYPNSFSLQSVTAVESEVLQLTKASRLHMGPYLCIGNYDCTNQNEYKLIIF